MNMKLKKKLAVILSLVTVFSAAFTSMAEIPAEAMEPVEIAKISSDQVVIPNTEKATVLEVEEVVEEELIVEEKAEVIADADLLNETGGTSSIFWAASTDKVLYIGNSAADVSQYGTPNEYEENSYNIPNWSQGEKAVKDIVKVVFVGKVCPSSTARWFYQMGGLTSIEGICSYLDTSDVKNMNYMFFQCKNLLSIDLSGFDTSQVEDMKFMFTSCEQLLSIDLSGFDTANVTGMANMFNGCTNLERIFASEGFTTGGVTESTGMFNNCSKLTGGAGTKWAVGNPMDKTYARIDGIDGNPGYFTAKTIADILPDDFPSSKDTAWVNGKGGKAYASDFYINFVGPKWTFCPEKKSTLDKTDKGYSYTDRNGQILFNMAGDELQSITIKDYTADDAVNGTYMKEVVITDLEITKAPDKTAYKEGEKFNPAGVELTLTYNNGLTRTVSFDSDDIKMTPDGELKASDKQIEFSVTVDGVTLTAAQPITVNLALVVLTGIEITKAPTRTVYTEGESFDPTGMTVTAVYSNGKTEAVTDYQITPAGALKTTDKEVEISYTNGVTVTAKQSITVNAAKKPDPTPSRDDDHEPLYTGTWNSPVKNGSWSQDKNGVWHYTSSEIFRNTWGYIVNPYATEGQHTADWFWFDRQGNMLTGWQFIGGKWYYLNPTKDGTLGACQLGGVTPDGWTVDESGAWIESIPKK